MNESKLYHGDYGTVVFNGGIYADDGFGTYIEADLRTLFYVMYNRVMHGGH